MLTKVLDMDRAYRYIYYRIYAWQLETWGEKEKPHDKGVLGIALLTFFNVLTLLAVLQCITGIEFTEIGAWPVEYLVVLILCHTAVHYYILFSKKRYKHIIAEYSQKNKAYHRRYTKWVVAYVVGSPILLLLSGLLAGYLR